MNILVYAICAAVGYLAGTYLPPNPASPYIPLMVSYHLFLLYRVSRAGITAEQKIGLSMPLATALITHFACLGALIGIVKGREYVPLFAFLQYIVPSLAPFEVKWIFKAPSSRRRARAVEVATPSGTMEEYTDFLVYMRRGKRKFQKAGLSLNDEYAAFRRHRSRNQPSTQ